jgi:hypothetical protein
MPRPNASPRQLAERLLILTATLADAVRQDRVEALEAILDERATVVNALGQTEIDPVTAETLSHVAREEQLVFEMLKAAREATQQQLAAHRAARRNLKGYRSGGEKPLRQTA